VVATPCQCRNAGMHLLRATIPVGCSVKANIPGVAGQALRTVLYEGCVLIGLTGTLSFCRTKPVPHWKVMFAVGFRLGCTSTPRGLRFQQKLPGIRLSLPCCNQQYRLCPLHHINSLNFAELSWFSSLASSLFIKQFV
jgi:hypothetical protein